MNSNNWTRNEYYSLHPLKEGTQIIIHLMNNVYWHRNKKEVVGLYHVIAEKWKVYEPKIKEIFLQSMKPPTTVLENILNSLILVKLYNICSFFTFCNYEAHTKLSLTNNSSYQNK